MDEHYHFEFSFGNGTFKQARDDCLSGTVQLQYATTDSKRQAKYEERGFHTMQLISSPQVQSAEGVTAISHFQAAYVAPSIPEVTYRRMQPSVSAAVAVDGGGCRRWLPRQLPAEFSILTLNCDTRLDGRNAKLVAETILNSGATLVCLQEVTVELYRLLLHDASLTSSYDFYSVMDKEHVLKAAAAAAAQASADGSSSSTRQRSIYGLAILTRVSIVEYWSLPLQCSPQRRRTDIAIGDGFAIANLHAESMQGPSSDQIREQQLPQVMAELRKGMAAHDIQFALLAGDLNMRNNGGALDVWLAGTLEDTNDCPVPTYIGDIAQTKVAAEDAKMRYYDRVLQARPAVMVAVGWRAMFVEGLSDHKVVVATIKNPREVV